MELKQQLKLTQQLIMTPQLQQAIKLLQLSRLELSDLIAQEINENPVLDETLAQEPETKDDGGDQIDEKAPIEDQKTEPSDDFDWRDYVDRSIAPSGSGYFDGGDQEDYAPAITRKTSFADHLLWQLHLHDLCDQEMEIGEYIIGNLNKDGYLLLAPDEVAADLGADKQLVEQVRRKIIRFDPVGVASRDLAECLIAQAELLPCNSELIKQILLHCMKELERKKYQVIARDLKIPLKDILEACEIIANMEPRPGRAFNDNETQYVTPDIYVYKSGDDYVVMLNEDGQPKLRINSFYKNILADNKVSSEKTKEYIQDKLRSAVWLIKSVYHRQSTIMNVMKSIIKFQRDFFDHGTGRLKPLVLRDVAEDVGMHESNVSRITTNKYVLTPHGIFLLKYFFNSGLPSDDGDSIASESVKNMIKDLVHQEDTLKPCSDQEIVRMLKAKGVNIARRTVTKYREMLGVLSSSKRKKHI
ncbi:MAG: RNA polymerase factor sigma-54 [Proteobacteria bacterium]|nr:RNA polymerase factor sigma-54 [Pseudomonadota bacterium]